MEEVVCACGCGKKFKARRADLARGWGKFFSKSCKAKAQERRSHQCRDHHQRQSDDGHGHIFEAGYFGHGQS